MPYSNWLVAWTLANQITRLGHALVGWPNCCLWNLRLCSDWWTYLYEDFPDLYILTYFITHFIRPRN
ncbi:hypothetical protein PHYPO_G00195070 [Pangasianodon hypophthalmus]|uniref:Uncharacterized protein n=1 Tax=Pangasianodon hypophthalmus TaxID=310915 RepID=A0A5N5PIJ4_PANHP|nr:hypothetical protein PHYPO_G00195070 [Pangasianodon hypophthalmus]